LRPTLERKPLHRDHVRILDFYLLFPFRIEGIRLTPKHRKYRKLGSKYEMRKPYGDQPDEDGVLFNRMEPMQTAAAETLAARNFLCRSSLDVGIVEASRSHIPPQLASRVAAANEHDADLIEFLEVLAFEYELTGVNGLKDRTTLLDHRYDAV